MRFKRKIRPARSWGMRLTGAWLIAQGLMPLLDLRFAHSGTVFAVLAVVAGVAVLFDI
jgi:hypothetical protein